METLVLHSKSEEDLKLLADLAKKMGVKVNFLPQEDAEDLGLLHSINKGRTGEYIETEEFLRRLKE